MAAPTRLAVRLLHRRLLPARAAGADARLAGAGGGVLRRTTPGSPRVRSRSRWRKPAICAAAERTWAPRGRARPDRRLGRPRRRARHGDAAPARRGHRVAEQPGAALERKGRLPAPSVVAPRDVSPRAARVRCGAGALRPALPQPAIAAGRGDAGLLRRRAECRVDAVAARAARCAGRGALGRACRQGAGAHRRLPFGLYFAALDDGARRRGARRAGARDARCAGGEPFAGSAGSRVAGVPGRTRAPQGGARSGGIADVAATRTFAGARRQSRAARRSFIQPCLDDSSRWVQRAA